MAILFELRKNYSQDYLRGQLASLITVLEPPKPPEKVYIDLLTVEC